MATSAAWNLEIERAFEYPGRAAIFAIVWQCARVALSLELPETRRLVGLFLSLRKQTMLALEYLHDENHAFGDGGSGENSDALSEQLALRF